MTTLTAIEIQPVIARVRRAMPRNADVMAVCDFAADLASRPVELAKPKFDKRAYQRELMRKRRAKGKA